MSCFPGLIVPIRCEELVIEELNFLGEVGGQLFQIDEFVLEDFAVIAFNFVESEAENFDHDIELGVGCLGALESFLLDPFFELGDKFRLEKDAAGEFIEGGEVLGCEDDFIVKRMVDDLLLLGHDHGRLGFWM